MGITLCWSTDDFWSSTIFRVFYSSIHRFGERFCLEIRFFSPRLYIPYRQLDYYRRTLRESFMADDYLTIQPVSRRDGNSTTNKPPTSFPSAFNRYDKIYKIYIGSRKYFNTNHRKLNFYGYIIYVM